MYSPPLNEIIQRLLEPGKGILAADESLPTLGRRFKAHGIPSTPESRRSYRELLFSTPQVGDSISGVILFDETIRQQTSSGVPFADALIRDGMVPGIKVDKGVVPLANFEGETITEGLDGLRDRLMEYRDLDIVINKIMAGWQPTEHQFTEDIIDRITIHEMGHAIVGILSKHHSKVSKVVINLSSPNSPGYTMFETSTSNIYKRESLFEHLMILLAGRISEEVFYDVSTTTGAINDFEEALKLAEKMIMYYGMGTNIIYPKTSEKYKQIMDDEVLNLINDAYCMSEFFVKQCKDLISECAVILKRDKILKTDALMAIIHDKYPHILDLKNDM